MRNRKRREKAWRKARRLKAEKLAREQILRDLLDPPPEPVAEGISFHTRGRIRMTMDGQGRPCLPPPEPMPWEEGYEPPNKTYTKRYYPTK